MELFRPDFPIKEKSEDKFQRYEFASRIADIVSTGQYPQSLVIGIYGKWGEGKSSVINFIHSEIRHRYPEKGIEKGPIVVHFNPWIFSDENQLLKIFFTTISKALGKRLKSKKQEFFNLISTYAEGIGTVLESVPQIRAAGNIFKAAKSAADKLKDDGLESLKERIDQIIINSGVNIVVFIDDIDRLNIHETQIVFKLVKLIAGFPRTAYILTFDDELVAKSLAGQYATSASMQPGYTFLEKIIQIPLHLPKADGSSLREFSLELIHNVHRLFNIKLTEREWSNFILHFEMAFLPALSNPRTAILYANSIGFIIPLIGKEVNISDLMILEAIKIFYPDIYHFIRKNPDYVLSKKNDSDRNRTMESDFNSILNVYSHSNAYLSYVLNQIFPLLPINGHYSIQEDEDTWFQEKRICSSKYFERYFTYSVQPGAISDVFFEDTMEKLFKFDIQASTEFFKASFSALDINTFLYKLNMHSLSLGEAHIYHLGLILRNVLNDFNDKNDDKIYTTSDKIIHHIALLARLLSPEKRIDYVIEVLRNIQPFESACKMTGSFLGKFAEYINDESEVDKLSRICYEQIILRHEQYISAGVNLAQLHNYSISHIFNAYYKMGYRSKLNGFVTAELMMNSRFAVRIIQMCSRVTYPPSQPERYELELLSTTKEEIEKLIPIDDLYQHILFVYGNVTQKTHAVSVKGSEYDYRAIAKFQKFHLNGWIIDKEI